MSESIVTAQMPTAVIPYHTLKSVFRTPKNIPKKYLKDKIYLSCSKHATGSNTGLQEENR